MKAALGEEIKSLFVGYCHLKQDSMASMLFCALNEEIQKAAPKSFVSCFAGDCDTVEVSYRLGSRSTQCSGNISDKKTITDSHEKNRLSSEKIRLKV